MNSYLRYQNIEQEIVTNLSYTRKSLKLAVAWFTNPNLFYSVEKLVDNNIEVQIILSDEKLNYLNNKIDFQKLIDKNVQFHVSSFPNLMHNKFCIIDSKVLITGSYNWTLKAEKDNYENVIVSVEPTLINEFEKYFEHLLRKTKRVRGIASIDLINHLSQSESEIELKLLKEAVIKNEVKKTIEIKQFIAAPIEVREYAENLYLDTKHQDCIKYCQEQLNEYSNDPHLLYSMASSYWRLNKTENQIYYATKIRELRLNDEVYYAATNLLGIAYSASYDELKAIEYFDECINYDQNNHIYYRNRADAYMLREKISGLDKRFKDKYTNHADNDLRKVLSIVSATSKTDLNYQLIHSKAMAYYLLGKRESSNLIKEAIDKFYEENKLAVLDKNELKEMKELQRTIQRELR